MEDSKINKLLDTEVVVNSTKSLRGLSAYITSTKIGGCLTESELNEFIEYMMSDLYYHKEIERQKIWAKGKQLINKALEQKIITLEEYMRLSITLSINGILTVNPKMYNRLKKVKTTIKEN